MAETDTGLIAAHLAAAVISKVNRGGSQAEEAVTIYFEVLKALEEKQGSGNPDRIKMSSENTAAENSRAVRATPVDD